MTPITFPPLIDIDHSTFDEELPGLVGKIEEILPDGDGHKILVLLERLMVGNTPVDIRFSFYYVSQTYEDLNDTQQTIVQNCMDALMLRGLLPPGEYLTDVQVFLGSIVGNGEFGNVYKGNWKGGLIAVKKFRPVTPPVFLIPNRIRCLILNNLQEHIEGLYRVNKWHLFLSHHLCLNTNISGEIYATRRGI